ncbi:hypothetical protein Pelo_4107 [Pelomyxa schiedti]|nr:hypothetical protein Pelo_4107 [Pelomyxa schiedti]
MFGGYAQAAGGGSYNRTPATAELAGKGGPLSATAQKYIRQRKYGEGGVHMSSSPPQYAAPGAYTTMAGIRVTPGEIVKIVVGAGGEGGREQGAASGSGYPGLVAVSWGGMIL